MGIAGGIFSQDGTLTITNSTIAGNFADNRGGGISSCSTLAITDSIVSGNGAGGGKNNWPGFGGGIEVISAPTSEVCELLEEVKKGQAYAILHCTC